MNQAYAAWQTAAHACDCSLSMKKRNAIPTGYATAKAGNNAAIHHRRTAIRR